MERAGRPLRVIFFARSHRYALSVLEEIRSRHLVAGVVESLVRGAAPPSRARAWLDRLLGRPSLELASRRAGIPFIRGGKADDDGLRAFIRGLSPDAGTICSFSRLLPPATIELSPRGILNMHPSLLPSYRGPSPTVWEFWNREPKGGGTMHFIDRGEDTGDIVAQAEIPIPFGTAGDEHLQRCHAAGARLMNQALDALSAGTIRAQPQRHQGSPFRARYLHAGEALIDWSAIPLEQVFHLLRGALPFLRSAPSPARSAPGPELQGRAIRALRAPWRARHLLHSPGKDRDRPRRWPCAARGPLRAVSSCASGARLGGITTKEGMTATDRCHRRRRRTE